MTPQREGRGMWLPRIKSFLSSDSQSEGNKGKNGKKQGKPYKRFPSGLQCFPAFQCAAGFDPRMFEDDCLSDAEDSVDPPMLNSGKGSMEEKEVPDSRRTSDSENSTSGDSTYGIGQKQFFQRPEREEKLKPVETPKKTASEENKVAENHVRLFRQSDLEEALYSKCLELPTLEQRAEDECVRTEAEKESCEMVPEAREANPGKNRDSEAVTEARVEQPPEIEASEAEPAAKRRSDGVDASSSATVWRQMAKPTWVSESGSVLVKPVQGLKVSLELPRIDAGAERRAMSMDTRPDKGLQLAHIFEKEYSDITALFRFDSVLGKGASGVVRKCFDALTGQPYACKTISKTTLKCKLDVRDLKAEVRSLRTLQNHPFVVKLKAVFEDAKSVHIVMEYCKGGDLFTRIKQRRYFTEPEAAVICRSLASVLASAHENGIMHRDLKPENILLVSPHLDVDICLADFGSSAFFKPGQKLNQLIGSPLYIAPSVLQHHYGPEADLWSLGVVLFILLAGVPPFWGRHNGEIFRNVQYGELRMDVGRWAYISKGAKKLVVRLLNRDDKQRISAKQVLKHPWILHHCPPDETADELLGNSSTMDLQDVLTRSNSNHPFACETSTSSKEKPLKKTVTKKSSLRRHSLGTEKAVGVAFAEEVEIFGDDGGKEILEDPEMGKCVLQRSPTPFRTSSNSFPLDDDC